MTENYNGGNMKHLYKVKNLKKTFGRGEGKTDVLKGIDFKIRKGEIVTILGPSGSGKSTLLHILGGLDTADEGTVFYKGRDITVMNKKERMLYRRNEVGFVFQFYNLLGDLTAKENIESCAYLSGDPMDLEEIMETLELSEHQNKFPSQLSGGQQQRVAFGRALVKKSDVLLCDEPTGALDYKRAKEILLLLERINRTYGTTLIIVTHNENIKDMAHHVIKLRDGVIAEDYKNRELKRAKDINW